MTTPAFPGYRLDRLVGAGPVGEAWAGSEVSTGAPRLLRRLRPAIAPRAAERLLAADPPGACFVPVHGVVTSGREVAVVSDLAPGGSLRSAGRQPLARFAALGGALAHLHAEGVLHGALTPANVLVGDDGLLLDPDITRLLAAADGTAHRSPYADGPPCASADVRAFALLCLRYAVDAPQDVLRAAAESPAADRPGMAELAEALAAAPVLVPADVTASAPAPSHAGEPRPAQEPAAGDGGWQVPDLYQPGRGRRRPGRVRRWPAVALLALVAVAGAGLGLAAGGDRAGPMPARLSAGPDWAAVVTDLVAARAAAIRELDPVALAAVYATGAGQRAADVAALLRLRAAGASAVPGYATTVRAVGTVTVAADRVRLTLTDALPAYDVVSVDGRVLEQVPPRAARTWTVVLAGDGGRWRLWSVDPG